MNIIKRLVVWIFILSISLSLSPAYGQPFWTEKSTYYEGDYLYAVGIATNVSNKEDGRTEAFDNGVREVCNLIGVTELPQLEIRTQMTYEEDHKDGTYTVYRLLKINGDALDEEVDRIQEEDDIEEYVQVWPSGTIKVKGYLKKIGGKFIRTGKWIWMYRDGKNKGEENYKNGLRHGQMFEWYDNGIMKEKAVYRYGRLHGKGTTWYNNGQKRIEAEYRNGQAVGKQIYWYKNGQKKEEGEYRDGKLHGMGIMWYENGQKEIEGGWYDGKPHGKVIRWYKSGQKMDEAEWNEGKRQGKWITWYEDGQKKTEEEYCDDKIIHENGQNINENPSDPLSLLIE